MGTPALIIVNNNGTYMSCICNGDGYLVHTGKKLEKYWNLKEDAIELVNGGDFKGMYEPIEYFDGNTAMHRTSIDLKELIRSYPHISRIYLYEDNIWSMLDDDSLIRLYWYGMARDYIHLECSICGFEEKIDTENNDFGNWVSEAFLGQKTLGPVCPACQERFTGMSDNGECEVILSKIIFTECPGLLSIFSDFIE